LIDLSYGGGGGGSGGGGQLPIFPKIIMQSQRVDDGRKI
jgi:hypothetical protein